MCPEAPKGARVRRQISRTVKQQERERYGPSMVM